MREIKLLVEDNTVALSVTSITNEEDCYGICAKTFVTDEETEVISVCKST